jgi:hypothetical protein
MEKFENEQILREILENTEKVKTVVLKNDGKIEKKSKIEGEEKTPHNKKTEKTAQQRAVAKFKRVGTQLNETELAQFEEILKENNTNANAYIKSLIFEDKTPNVDIQRIEDLLLKQKKLIEEQKIKIEEFENLTFWEKLGRLF